MGTCLLARGAADDHAEALDWLSHAEADVGSWTWGTPVLSGIEATGQITRRSPSVGTSAAEGNGSRAPRR